MKSLNNEKDGEKADNLSDYTGVDNCIYGSMSKMKEHPYAYLVLFP